MKKSVLVICFFSLIAGCSFSQVLVPFVKRYDITQRGGLVMVSNSMLTCNGGFGCSSGQNEVPPAGTKTDNDFNSAYIDIDGDPSTFSSSNATLNIPACSKITFAGLYWGAAIENTNPKYAQRNKIKIKQPGAGSYTILTADAINNFNINYGAYNCFKNITSIVSGAGNGIYTMADLVSETGDNNQWAGWGIVVVYNNDALQDKNFTVFDGVASIDNVNWVTITTSGFYTPPSGAVNFELGEIAYDGDRGNTGDSLLFKGAASFVKVTDGLHPANDVFNSTIANNGVQTLTRNPAYKNTLGYDANIFAPNNATKNYLSNGASSAQIKVTSGGDQIFLQVITAAIETYEPFMRTTKTVSDINGGIVKPGDTLLYTITINNNGNDDAGTTSLIDTLPFNGNYVPGSINITSGPNSGLKTDAGGDDQASYSLSAGLEIIKVNLGLGANSVVGGTISQNGVNSTTTVTFKLRITDDCTKLICNPTVSNHAAINYKGIVSGIPRMTFSNPSLLDPFGCPVKGYTSTDVIVPVTCSVPPDSSIGGCLPLKFDSVPGIQPGYVYYNSSWVSVIRANTAGTYYGVRTITGTSCKDTITYTVFLASPTVSNSGPDQSLCNVSTTTLAGNTPAVGAGKWTVVSGPGAPNFTINTSPTTTVTGLISGTYKFRWTISLSCDSSSDTVQVIVYATTTISNAGPDQNLCNVSSTSFAGNTPAAGTGTWTRISGPNIPTITSPANPSSTVTGMIPGVYIFQWTITNGVCASSSDNVQITISALPTTADAGPDQNLCNATSTFLAGNIPGIGSGMWTVISGPNAPTITTPSSPTSSMGNMINGVYSLRWTISNGACANSTDDVQITIYALPTVADAGPDQSQCNVNSVILSGNVPVIGNGNWTMVSGPNVPTITTPGSSNTIVNGMIAGVYIFRWTISNGICASSTNDVQVTINALPSVSNAGADQLLCNVNSTTFAGNSPAIGSGTWTMVSGPNTPTITSASNPTSTVTGMIAGIYVFRWTISNGVCSSSSDDVQITISDLLTVSDAGPDQNLCNVNSITLAGNTAVFGTGNWVLVSGPNSPTITTVTNPTSTVTGMIAGVYTFRWIISNSICPASTDEVQITIYAMPTISNAGPDQNLCNVTSTIISGNTPAAGTGNWTLVSGPNAPTITSPGNSNTTVTGMIAGVYVFRWTISNGMCASSADDIQVSIFTLPTVSIAGPDQNLCNVNTTSLAGNVPISGSGNWTLVSGPNAPTITTPSNPTSTITGMIAGVYVFRWTISNGACSSSTDDIQITIFDLPTVSNAGPDQNLCNVNNTVLSGNAPAAGTGTWTLMSGPNTPTITTPTSPASTVTGMIAGVYTFRWIISNGVCASSTDDVQITVYALPTVSNAGPDQSLCNASSTIMAGNNPVNGTGNWTVVSGPNAPTITTSSNPSTTVTGMITGVYVFRWTISNGVCATSTDDIQITNYDLPTVSNAGPDQTLCNVNSTTLAGNSPAIGSGTWTLISGPGVPTITTPTSASSTVTGMITGVYIFRWTITNGVCAPSMDDVQITILALPTVSNAGPDQNLCNVNNTTLAGNTPVTGSGNWTLVSGPNAPTITTPSNPASTITGMIAGVYIFRWTVSNGICASSTDDIQIIIYSLPTISNAGPDQNLCNLNNTTLAGNNPVNGNGNWILVSGPNVPSITTPSNPSSTITGMIAGTYIFRWTISNGVCTPSSDDVQIRIYDLPAVSVAGANQDICDVTSITLAGNTPTTGTGNWTLISGPNVPTITDASNPVSTVSGMITGAYVFEWTISNGVCAPSFSDVTITIYNIPTLVDAGPDQDLCNVDSATMAGNVPGVGTGTWSFISGPNTPSIALPNDPGTIINGMITGTYQFGWTITNGVCFTPMDTITVTIDDLPTTSVAGPDEDMCSVTSVNLYGNIPLVGTGLWTNVSGPNTPSITLPDSASTTVTGMITGVYVFRWTITNGSCAPSFSDVQVTIYNTPLVVNAGPDQQLCDSATALMAGNIPGVGTGTWTLISGPNTPTITTINNPSTTITGMIAGTYIFGWTITNGVCVTPTDSVRIIIYDSPTVSDAGSDQKLCNVNNTVMAANTATSGTGNWSLISGPNTPVITDSTSETTSITGMTTGTYVFRWTISNGNCNPSFSNMTVDIYGLPSVANAGPDQSLCITDSVILSGNIPAVGSGVWKFISGPNTPFITDTTNANTSVTGLIQGVYLFAWTIKNGICIASSDTVQVTQYSASTISNAGADQNLCNVSVISLSGNIPVNGSGMWTMISGPNVPITAVPSDHSSTVSGLIGGAYQFVWTITNGTCSSSRDTVIISINNLPTVANAGPDQSLCAGSIATLAGNMVLSGSGIWTLSSGPNIPTINVPADSNTTVSGLIPGTYVFNWTISNGTCAISTDSVAIVIFVLPTFVDAGPDQDLCNVTNITLAGNTPTSGTGTWSFISGPNVPSVSSPNNPATLVSGIVAGVYLFSWNIAVGVCLPFSDTLQIIVHDLPTIADAGQDQSLCNVASTTLLGNSTITGTGVWTLISGPNSPTIVDVDSGTTLVNGMMPGVYQFSWSISNGICAVSTDTVQISIFSIPPPSNAGPDQHLCNVNSVIMAGNNPAPGVGTWTYVSGPNFPGITSPNNTATSITGMIQGTYVFSWLINNGVCSTAPDVVTIIIDDMPTVPFAGPDQSLCDDTTFILSGNVPVAGSGVWTFISGPNIPLINSITSASVYVENLIPGNYIFTWTISNGICSSLTDTVQIASYNVPAVANANAGPDQNICNADSSVLAGNIPASGTGWWTLVSGPNTPVITDSLDEATSVTGMINGTYLFLWTISNGVCVATTDTVQIKINDLPTISDAGLSQGLCNISNVTLGGNVPVTGTGLWTFVSGPNIPTIVSPSSPTSNVTGLIQGNYYFNWEISNGNCSSSNDTVRIIEENPLTPANAGTDMIFCNTTLAPTDTLLSGNSPLNGTGTWTLVSGPGGSVINSPNSPITNVSGLINGVYIFRWTISNVVCTPLFDDVQITVNDFPGIANAGPDQKICNSDSAVMAGNTPLSGVGVWTIIIGPNSPVFTDSTSATTSVTGMVAGNYIFVWKISNGVCIQSSDTVQIYIYDSPTIADAGPDQELCNGGYATMGGNTPVVGTGTWTFINGPNVPSISSPASPVSNITGMIHGTYLFSWDISNGSCLISSDTVIITIEDILLPADAGADMDLCDNSFTPMNIVLTGNTPVTGIGTWTLVGGPVIPLIVSPNSPVTNVTGLDDGVYIFRWTISNGVCTPQSDDILVSVHNIQFTTNAGSDQLLCGTDSAIMSADTALLGIGTWSNISGPNIPAFVSINDPLTTVTGMMPGSYLMGWTISNGNCYSATDTVQVTILNLSTASDAGPDQIICSDSIATLTGNTPSSGNGIWSLVSGPSPVVLSNSNSPNCIVSGLIPGDYFLSWTISNGVCANTSDVVRIKVDLLPSQSSAGSDQVLCGDTFAILSGNTPVVGSGTWTLQSGPGIPVISCDSCPNTQISGLLTGFYTYIWTIDNTACGSTVDSVMITRIDDPGNAIAGSDQIICEGDTVLLSANAATYGNGLWSVVSGPGSLVINPPDSSLAKVTGFINGSYILRWTLSNGVCTRFDEMGITANPIPVTITNASLVNICPGEQATLIASGADSYIWTPPNDLSDDTIFNPIASPLYSTIYTVTGISLNGCTSTSTVVVDVCDLLMIPSGFSPDGDGVNDKFEITGIDRYPNLALHVFNRWGNLIYEKQNYDNSWDGIPNVNGLILGGGKIPAGTYFYIVELNNGSKDRTGYLEIKY